MSEAVQIALIASIPPTLTGIATLLYAIRINRQTDGMNKIMRQSSHDEGAAEGHAAGVKDEKEIRRREDHKKKRD